MDADRKIRKLKRENAALRSMVEQYHEFFLLASDFPGQQLMDGQDNIPGMAAGIQMIGIADIRPLALTERQCAAVRRMRASLSR